MLMRLVLLKKIVRGFFQFALRFPEMGDACEFSAFKIPKDRNFFVVQFERRLHPRYSFVALRLGMIVLRNRVPSCSTYGTKYAYPSMFRTMIS